MPGLDWYAQRLKAMSPREIAFRLQRSATIQLQRLAGPGKPPTADISALAPASAAPEHDSARYLEKAEMLSQGRIDVFACRDYFLGDPPDWSRDPRTGRVAPRTFGKTIDYRDQKIVGNIKYLWEPSRHLMLPALAQAYRLSGDRKYLRSIVDTLDSWIDQCPYPSGIHWCSSLEVAIRLINWSFAWRIAGGTDIWREADGSGKFLSRWLDVIYYHMHFIDGYYSAHSSANNHLIGEAAGVYVGSVTWPAWAECERWRRHARSILVREIQAQTHHDGVNAEQAMAYQQFVLDFFIVAGLAGRQVDEAFPESYWSGVERMLQFIASMMDVNGNVPMIGDADDGFVVDLSPESEFCNYRSLLATGAILFDRGDFAAKAGALDAKTSWLLPDAHKAFAKAVSWATLPVPQREFPDGGYYVLGNDFNLADEVRIIFDAGPLGMGRLAAHGHADALAFHLSVSGTPVIIDPGTYAYHTDKRWRNYFRGTSAHNTVRVDGQDQSRIGGNFLWTKHATAIVEKVDLEGSTQIVVASHDGYLSLADPVTHKRTLIYDRDTRRIRIDDQLVCSGSHEVEIFFHFPEFATCEHGPEVVTVTAREHALVFRNDHGFIGESFRGDDKLPLGWVSYSFDTKLPSCSLRYRGRIEGSTTLVTNIQLIGGEKAAGKVAATDRAVGR